MTDTQMILPPTDARPAPAGTENPDCCVLKPCRSGVSSSRTSANHSRSHSPIKLVPRRSSGSGSLPDVAREGGEGGEEAPLGYEPCGSAGDESPYSERSTPNVLRWAKDLQFVLDDYEGYRLFEQFLTTEGCTYELIFYYACKGLQKRDPNECPSETQALMAGIYKRFIRSQGECVLQCLDAQTRSEIVGKIHARNYQPSIFLPAIDEVVRFLQMKHEAFIRSDLYISAVEQNQLDSDSPRVYGDSSGSSTCDEQTRTSNMALPTLHEEENEHSLLSRANQSQLIEKLNVLTVDVSKCDDSMAPRPSPGPVDEQPPPLPPRQIPAKKSLSEPAKAKLSPTPTVKKKGAVSVVGEGSLTAASLEATISQRSAAMGAAAVAKLTSTLPRQGPSVLPHPYHTNYVPKLPPSMRDSAVSSAISSEADTVSGANEQKGCRQVVVASRKEQHRDRVIRDQQMIQNLETNLKDKIIPRTQREIQQKYNASGDRKEQELFAAAVIEKLNKVRKERETGEKLNESLRTLSEAESQANPIASRCAVQAFGVHCQKNQDVLYEEDKLILEDHMGKIGWDDSNKASPGSQRSPGTVMAQSTLKRRTQNSRSPERRLAASRAMTSSVPSAAAMASQPRVSNPSAQFAHKQTYDRRPSLPSNAKVQKQQRTAMRASDTSGIESGTSSGASCFSGIMPASADRWLLVETADKVRRANASHRPHRVAARPPKPALDSSSLPRSNRARKDPMSSSVRGEEEQPCVVIGYHLPNEEVPYRTKVPGRCVTLRQFKQVLPKKQGCFKYYFKSPSDEFEAGGVVQKEITEDAEVLPLWEGKIWAKVVAVE